MSGLPVLSDNFGVRLDQLSDLYAPMGEDGKRHPEHGVISREDFLKLANEAPCPEADDAEAAVAEYLARRGR